MKAFKFLLSVLLGTGYFLPLLANAADGDLCTSPAAGVSCYILCDKTAPGSFNCEFTVPNGGKNLDAAIIRAYRGTSASGCGYDDTVVASTTDTNAGTAGFELPSLGTLDDDGSGSGLKQIVVFGPIGPVIRIDGTATNGTCDGNNPLQIQLLLYPKQIN
jgi:hypothetical protein